MFKSSLFGIAALALSMPGIAVAAPTQWAENGHYYEVISGRFIGEEAFFDAAMRTHLGLQGYVTTITSAEEQAFINAQFGTRKRYYIGASDRDVEGDWIWANGPEEGQRVADGYSNWAPGEPNNYRRGEDYALVNWRRNGRWNDIYNDVRYSYIIEYGGILAPVPLPAGGALLFGALAALGLRRRLLG